MVDKLRRDVNCFAIGDVGGYGSGKNGISYVDRGKKRMPYAYLYPNTIFGSSTLTNGSYALPPLLNKTNQNM